MTVDCEKYRNFTVEVCTGMGTAESAGFPQVWV